jgi:uncharacterized protein YkwD
MLALALASLAASPPAQAADPVQELLAPSGACPRPKETLGVDEAKRDAMLCLVNWARARNGLRPLQVSSRLELAAKRKADAILRCGLSHEPCRIPSRSFLRETAYGAGRRWSVGENLALVSRPLSARAVLALWLESADHRANVLNPSWRDIGIAEAGDGARDDPTVVWVVEFGWAQAG